MLQSNMDTVRKDIKTLVADAQLLFKDAAAEGGAKADELRKRGMQLLDSALDKAHHLQEAAIEKGKELADSTDNYVRKNPWRAVGISAVVGVLVGMLIARSK